VTSNQRLQNRQMRDIFSELSPSHCGAGNLFASRAFPKASGPDQASRAWP
jgi:hypothetical protein